MKEKLTYIEEQLKKFILNDKNFFELAKKYTFSFRDFSPYLDYCIIQWNNKDKKWEFLSYYCHNTNNEFPKKSTHGFNLDLNIDGFSWGSLYSEIEFRFENHLKNLMISDDAKEKSEEYERLRKEYFEQNKIIILNDWFKLTEQNIETYFKRMIYNLREQKFEKKIA